MKTAERITIEQTGSREFAVKVGEVIHHYVTGTIEQAEADAARLRRGIAFDAKR
jgi:hypothetical protein